MNKMIGQLVLALALISLAGCGLKGPLYFPPKEQPNTPQKQQSNKQIKQQNSRTVQTDSDVSNMINSKRAN